MMEGTIDLQVLEEELKKLGIVVVSGYQDTIFSVQIKGLVGKALVRGLHLTDQLLQAKLKHVLKVHVDPHTKLFVDPTFGPCAADPLGAAALCKTGSVIPSKAASQHQMKVLGLLQKEKIRWERPQFDHDDAGNGSDSVIKSDENEDYDDSFSRSSSSTERVFASNARLFSDGCCSGDVIQGNLGDCWFLSALSVVATRSDLLEQTFWRGDKYKSKGLFVCRFMKNFVWNYVIIDDRLPVFGFSKSKEGKPYFARCRDPNELWVPFLEKAYAKLHGSYEALIGGFVDVALNDLTGMCSEQVILKEGFPGFGENPLAPVKSHQQIGDAFWEKILRYRDSGTLMGCSIQPVPTGDKTTAAESSAGNGLYFKHAYALVDAGQIKTTTNELVKLVKLRNPWGMGEWTGPWSDSSDERTTNQDVIETYFKILKRKVGGNASKRVFLTLNGRGELQMGEISQDEVIEANVNDGTFFMSFDAWMTYFTHFFAGIDFPDAWHGRRVEGSWNDLNCGGNITKSTWINNPHFELTLEQRANIFVSLSQEDPRGKESLKIVPIGFHICSLIELGAKSNKFEIKEPSGKPTPYYRLYKEKDRVDYQKGIRPEPVPPAIIPGSVIPGVDDDGVPQPAYTFKQAVSASAVMDPGKYCIVPSMYMRTDKDTGKTNVGRFWISVYSDKASFCLEGGEKIAEEEEGDEELSVASNGSTTSSVKGSKYSPASNPAIKSDNSVASDYVSAMVRRRKFEDAKEELLSQARAKGIGLRELKVEFSKATALKKTDCRRKFVSLGFKPDELSDEKVNLLLSGLEDSSRGTINSDKILQLFESEIQEDQMACELPDIEDDNIPERPHQGGIFDVELYGAKDLAMEMPARMRTQHQAQRIIDFPVIAFNTTENAKRMSIAMDIFRQNPALLSQIRPFIQATRWISSDILTRRTIVGGMPRSISYQTSPVATFLDLLEHRFRESERKTQVDVNVDNDPFAAVSKPSISFSNDHTTLHNYVRGVNTYSPTMTVSVIHRSERMRTLESKRWERLKQLQTQKLQALGDHQKIAALPRLLGGQKRSSVYIQCIECSFRIPITTRSDSGLQESFKCAGSSCMSMFCKACYILLPEKKKLCEDCFEHEVVPSEIFGEQLRSILIEKVDASVHHRSRFDEVFRSFDIDASGALSKEEFGKALELLGIQPPLTEEQKDSLMGQFDTNHDEEVSLSEFKDWILKNQVWYPAPAVSGSTVASVVPPKTATRDILDTVIAPLVNEIINAAFNALTFSSISSHWTITKNTTSANTLCVSHSSTASKANRKETGIIIFQRVMKLALLPDEDTLNAAERIFARFDADRSGNIDLDEFVELLSTLGLRLNASDAQLLMHRFAPQTNDGTIGLMEFTKYLINIMEADADCRKDSSVPHNHRLSDILNKIHTIATRDSSKRQTLCDILGQMHWNMREEDALGICKTLQREVGLFVDVGTFQRLSNAFFFREFISGTSYNVAHASANEQESGTIAELKNSGEVLNSLLFISSDAVMMQVNEFNVQSVCEQLLKHLERQASTTSIDGMWKHIFGLETTDTIDQRDFLDVLLRSGFCISTNPGTDQCSALLNRLTTKLIVALTLDAMRSESGQFKVNDAWNDSVSFQLFTLVVWQSKISEVSAKFDRAFSSLLLQNHGHQQYLVSVALDNKSLVVRANDPVLKFEAELILREDEFAYGNLVAHLVLNEQQSMEECDKTRGKALNQSPYGIITPTCLPFVDNAILALLTRIPVATYRCIGVSAHHGPAPYLILIESEQFVSTLRSLLSKTVLPFFCSVSPQFLQFVIDGTYLDELNVPTFQELVTETLRERKRPSLRALVSLIQYTSSSLQVRFEVIGKNATAITSWGTFQASLAGHQDTYAVLELQPQGDVFTTLVDRASGTGTLSWNFKKQIVLREPEECDQRVDRPIVYTDTVQISSIIDGRSSQKISFVMSNKAPKDGHFVVLNVRRAPPSGKVNRPRLYCTAYDPLTSCDYSVEGYPNDWPADFFNPTVNPDFEIKWQNLLKTMYLGVTMTSKIVVKVLNKQAKADKLLGECEVSVGSAIAHEGHVFDDWFALHHPVDRSQIRGCIRMSFRFDAKKINTADNGEDSSSESNKRLLPVEIQIDNLELNGNKHEEVRKAVVTERGANADREHEKQLQEMQMSLEASERAKVDAQDQIRNLRAQVQQMSFSSSTAMNGEAARWKSKLDLAKQQHLAEQEENEKRVIALQREVKRLEDEFNKQNALINPSPKLITNLQQAALSAGASAHDILSVMKEILINRCPERPYNGLKKALAAIADVPGKVAFAAFDDVLIDFGLTLSPEHRKTISSILDPETRGRINIEDFFIKLCGDAEAYSSVSHIKSRVVQIPAPSERSPDRLSIAMANNLRSNVPTPAPVPSRPKKMNWKEMKQFLIMNLPDGWETRFTEKGKPYFCNHEDRSTQWKHPRPEIEAKFNEWLQENGASFSKTSSSTRSNGR